MIKTDDSIDIDFHRTASGYSYTIYEREIRSWLINAIRGALSNNYDWRNATCGLCAFYRDGDWRNNDDESHRFGAKQMCRKIGEQVLKDDFACPDYVPRKEDTDGTK